jgi:Ca-activated chloride channel homolog
MTIQLTDEKLTAYALGELEETERAAVEAALADDEDARQTVADLEALAELATEALADEPATALTDEQREAIAARAGAVAEPRPGEQASAHTVPQRRKRRWPWLAAAAGLVLVLGVGALSVRMFMLTRALGSGVIADYESVEEEYAHEIHLASKESPTPSLAEPARAQLEALGYVDAGDAVADESGHRMSLRDRNASLEPVPPSVHDPNKKPDDVFGEAGLLGEEAWIPGVHGTEAYDHVTDNAYFAVTDEPLSTFSIDVDTASYSNVRRHLDGGSLPPAGAVRIEELVNYFDYDYEAPSGRDPFTSHVEVAGCPWNADHRLARIGLKGWEIPNDERPQSNLVFLLDVSGSMNQSNKLPLLKDALGLLVEQLGANDRVAIVVYAGAAGLVLPSTAADDDRTILGAMDRLKAGGSTHGSAGIHLAYETATDHFIEGGVNRVILATDGDFNVGTTSQAGLIELVEEKARTGIFLTVLGFGMGNYKDSTLENLADKGNGNYAYIDTQAEARKVLVEEISGTLVTIAKDVKIQVEFNPAQVGHYRLIGYENRILAAEDFNDDTKDAGEIGAGHTVTALYEIVPVGVPLNAPGVDPLKYQQPTHLRPAASSGELMTLKLRYKEPDGHTSTPLAFPITDSGRSYAEASADFKFAAAVASFGMLLRGSPYKGTSSYDGVIELAGEGAVRDRHGYRAEFIQLVRKARNLSR